ncbi:hypothetical protein [Pseudomonas putida]|uniref:Uncharacterized protein n=1 Tax=Pseudomonas putida (strain DOT-T1E) TaxID=1196325 RepID=I7AX03_PSEPT|nr:hypothetical protein [Pseudomonas putida]AFO47215.1 hypothetical protein T1E_1360 [Pseudomonas putida DOT-T1E]UZM95174.1 hypothetical protein OPZ46_07065 [Pseudomonas putida DOT-T1E]
MASITNISSHRIDLADLSLAPGEAIEHFDDREAERLKSTNFYRAGWIKVGPSPEPEQEEQTDE